MSEKQETIADLVVMLRSRADDMEKRLGDQNILVEHNCALADRIEAAHKREVDNLNSVTQAQRSAFDAEQDRWRREHLGNAAQMPYESEAK